MSDPFRDAAARKRSDDRQKTIQKYTPVVLWVKVPDGERIHNARDAIQERAVEMPYVNVKTKNEPFWFATDGVKEIDSLTIENE
jgi:hypothetical protein